MKICKSCLVEVPLEDFSPSKMTKDGREGKCRVCRAANRKKHKRVCGNCNIEYESVRNASLFCTKKCSEENRISRVLHKCPTCNNQIEVTPARVSHGKNVYCSKKCWTDSLTKLMLGSNNHNYTGNEIVNCHSCAKEIKVKPSVKRKNKYHFCSMKCCKEGIGSTRVGELNGNYNANKTLEDRIRARNYPEYRAWRTSVFDRDKYSCINCKNSKSGNLIAHHLFSYAKNPTLRTEIGNGVTLCTKCHSDFHSRFGYYNNTEEQFRTFMESKIS